MSAIFRSSKKSTSKNLVQLLVILSLSITFVLPMPVWLQNSTEQYKKKIEKFKALKKTVPEKLKKPSTIPRSRSMPVLSGDTTEEDD